MSTPRYLSSHATYYYQGPTLVKEQTEAGWFLQAVYGSYIGWPVRALARTWLAAWCAGLLHDSTMSKRYIEPFIKRHNIDMNQFVVPQGGFQSFNQFFYRALAPGARTINTQVNVIVSPADGKVLEIPYLLPKATFFLKQLPCNLLTLLGNATLAHHYSQGTMLMTRLAPYDYHRFHFPFDCIPEAPIVLQGRYESVNPKTFKNGIQPLTCNTRTIMHLRTKEHGTITMIAVGAMLVGSIITTYKPETAYKAGDQAGYFAFGGSTVLLLFSKDIMTTQPDIHTHTAQGFETAVLVGQEIATWRNNS